MVALRPFFPFYGGKWRAALRYPDPVYGDIIEPFAGSAGYAVRYPDRRVSLFDADEYVSGVWGYLIKVSTTELLRLPDFGPGQIVDDLKVPQEARWLIGFWITTAASSPRKSLSKNGRQPREHWLKQSHSPRPLYWSSRVRERLANQVEHIRHWRITHGDYRVAGNQLATWYIDPPYTVAGKHYRCRVDDFQALAEWTRSRRGQVIACEGDGATWLPFRELGAFRTNASRSGRSHSNELIWTGGQV